MTGEKGMKVRGILAVLCVAALASGCGSSATGLDLAKKAKRVAAVRPAAVVVEFTMRTDQGESPRGGYARGYRSGSFEEVIDEERPYEQGGWLVGPTTVVTQDPHVASRFVKEVKVRVDNELVPAKVSALARDRDAVFIEMAKPLKGAKPLVFEADVPGPYAEVVAGTFENDLTLRLEAFSPVFVDGEKSGRYLEWHMPGLVIDGKGRPAGLCLRERTGADEKWKGSPLAWAKLTTEEVAKRTEALDAACKSSIVRVRLGFRSPSGDRARGRYGDGETGRDESSTEANVCGLVTAPDRVLVLAPLPAKLTARLEHINISTPDNGDVPAKFVASLTDYGALVVAPERPVGPPVKMAGAVDLRTLRERLLFGADVRIQGENRVVHFTSERFDGLGVGWRRQLYPEMVGGERLAFLFDDAGALVAIPISRRPKAGDEDYRRSEPLVTPTTYLAGAFKDPAAFADANNVPLSEAAENRLGWLGAELQPLNRELARLNKVSDLTQDGQTGAIVAAIYPDSPAEKGGLKTGDILLRFHIEGYPKPVEVHLNEFEFAGPPFPWEHLDRIGEQYYDQLPCPWPGVNNSVSAILTEAGFGKKFDAEIFRDGKTMRLPFVVTEAPAHYESAPRFKSKPLGMTVRDLTFEALRYFHRTPEEPGVIISNIERGSKASVSGLKPFEIILAVNEKPVRTIKEFETAVTSGEELRFNVLRLNKTHIVKISLKASGGTTAPAPEQGN